MNRKFTKRQNEIEYHNNMILCYFTFASKCDYRICLSMKRHDEVIYGKNFLFNLYLVALLNIFLHRRHSLNHKTKEMISLFRLLRINAFLSWIILCLKFLFSFSLVILSENEKLMYEGWLMWKLGRSKWRWNLRTICFCWYWSILLQKKWYNLEPFEKFND